MNSTRRRIRSSAVAAACLAVVTTAPLAGNGGTLRLANVPMGEYLVSVFTDPTPVRPDSMDVSVLVLRAGMDGVADDVRVTVHTRHLAGHGPGQTLAATREQADDPRYYAAKFAPGAEGRWEVTVDVEGIGGSGSASFEVTAREPGPLRGPLALTLLALLPLVAAAWWIFREGEPVRPGE